MNGKSDLTSACNFKVRRNEQAGKGGKALMAESKPERVQNRSPGETDFSEGWGNPRMLKGLVIQELMTWS